METLIPYAIWAVMILIGLGLISIVLFGMRSLAYGKINPLTITLISLPVVLLVVLGFVMGDWTLAAVWALLITLGIAAVSLLLSGLRSMFGM